MLTARLWDARKITWITRNSSRRRAHLRLANNALDPIEAVGILFDGMFNGVSPPRSSLLPIACALLMQTTLSVCNFTGRLNSAAAER